MKDSELRAIALRQFYNDRRTGVRVWNEFDVPQGVDSSDFFAVCGQLAEHRLIEWQPHGKNGARGGRGKIIAAGIDVVEETVKSPIEITFDHSQTVNIHHSPNAQVGNHNSISTVVNVEKINAAIDHSNFSAAEKAEAKSRLSKFLDHPIIASIFGGLASTIKTS